MDGTHRIKIRLDDVEFDAEGSAEHVSQQYQAFLETLRLLRGLDEKLPPERVAAGRPTGEVAKAEKRSVASGEAETAERGEAENTALDEVATLRELVGGHDRIFETRERGEVVIPKLREWGVTPPDALLVLLLGYVLKIEEEGLTGIWLTRSMKGSGYPNVERVDELVEDPDLVSSHGQYRGKRYTLTFMGGIKAWEVLEEILKDGDG